MGFLDNAKDKLTKAVDDHGDKISGGIDKAAEAVDQRTGGKHADKIAGGADKAKDALEGLDGRADDDLTARTGEGLTQPGAPTDPNNPTG